MDSKEGGLGEHDSSGKTDQVVKDSVEGLGDTDIFRRQKKPNAERISKFISDLLTLSGTSFPIQYHSSDQTGALGEDIPSWVLLCREFNECKSASPSQNVQTQTNRIVNAVVQQTLMEPREPLGETGALLRSQIGADNCRVGNDPPWSSAFSIMRYSASILGIVGDAGVQNGVAQVAAIGVSSAVRGVVTGSGRV